MARVNDDWAWDQYDLVESGGQVDIKNDSFLADQSLTRRQRDDIETQFIDELYGTDDAVWSPEGGLPVNQNTGDGLLQSRGSYVHESIIPMGLDLRRVLDESITGPEHPRYYEWLTRGEVDWASYENDAAFKAAYNSLKDTAEYKNQGWANFTWNELWDRGGSGDDVQAGDDRRVDFIRAANAYDSVEEGDPDKPWTDPNSRWNINPNFDNKYTSKYHHSGPNAGQPVDGSKIEPYTATPLFNPNDQAIQDKLIDAEGNRMTIDSVIREPAEAGSRRDVGGAALDAGITIRRVNVKRPTNIPASWGSTK